LLVDGHARAKNDAYVLEAMDEGPVELLTARLLLRTPRIEDAPAIQAIAADPRVARTTASIPHPYPEDGAAQFIQHVREVANGEQRNLAIVLRRNREVIGMIGYEVTGQEAELAYMLSPAHWGQGYATEACRQMIAHIFEATRAAAVVARIMAGNKASEAVLRKVGFGWQGEAAVELPLRGGAFLTSFWRLGRDEV
jgi:RimJ/RimL family protein N-acetyltransferase